MGGYSDYFRARSAPSPTRASTAPKHPRARPASTAPRKPSFKEKRELAELPAKIEKLEAEKDALFDRMGAADFYRETPEEVARAKARLAEIDDATHAAYERWQELEALGLSDSAT